MKTLGPPNAKILILADYPSRQEFFSKEPLSDWAGRQFWDILASAGIMKSSCFVMSFLGEAPPKNRKGLEDLKLLISGRKTPPEPEWRFVEGAWVHPSVAEAHKRLRVTLEMVQPSLVIALGPAALWALSGHTNTLKWRGSRLTLPEWPFTILPTFAPRLLTAAPENSHLLRADLTRAKNIFEGTQKPRKYRFKIAPSLGEVLGTLANLEEEAEETPLLLSGDLETRAYHIACFGIAWTAEDAICIPSLVADSENPFYWTEEEEALILYHIHRLFAHPNITWVGQNFLYDCQYFHRFWLSVPKVPRDTMIGHHSIYSNTRKGLDFLSSIYAHDHVYWKDDIREWDPALGEKQYWQYNCKDACVTWEIWHELLKTVGEKSA